MHQIVLFLCHFFFLFPLFPLFIALFSHILLPISKFDSVPRDRFPCLHRFWRPHRPRVAHSRRRHKNPRPGERRPRRSAAPQQHLGRDDPRHRRSCQSHRQRYIKSTHESGADFLVVPLVRLSGHGDAVSAADWYAGGTRIVSAGWDKAVHLWDAQASGSPLSILPGTHAISFFDTFPPNTC